MNKRNIKKLGAVLAVLLLACLVLAGAGAATETTGSCGGGLTWSVDSENHLTIELDDEYTGADKGVMDNYGNNCGPWGTSIKSLSLPDGLTNIGNWAFYYCENLSGNLTIPSSVTTIGNGAFKGCSRFTGSLVIPDNVTKIGFQAFYDCTGFNGYLVLPSSVTEIGGSAFAGCIGLTGNLTIPSNIKTIEKQTFWNCSGFTGDLVIPSGVTSIDDYAFKGCNGISSVTIPSTVTTINMEAFNSCEGLTESLIIPSSVTTLGGYTFKNCDLSCIMLLGNLTKNSLDDFVGNALYSIVYTPGDISLLSYSYTKDKTALSKDNGDNSFTFTLKDSSFPAGFPLTTKNAPIKEGYTFGGWYDNAQYTGNMVTTVTNGQTLYAKWYLISSTCGDGLTWSVDNDKQLTILYDGVGTGIMTDYSQLGTGPWGNEITSVSLPSGLKHIGNYAFNNCNKLAGKLIIPSSVTSIGDYAFKGCSSITSVYLPKTISIIGKSAFESLSNNSIIYTMCDTEIPGGRHTHTYSTEWSYDANYHWHNATCFHSVISEYGAHEWGIISGEGTNEVYGCTICGYTDGTILVPSELYSRSTTIIADDKGDNSFTFTVDNDSFPSGFPLTDANAPMKEGDTFYGWYDNTGNPVTSVTDGQTLYAAWESNIPATVNVFWYQNALTGAGLQPGWTYTSPTAGASFTVPSDGDILLTEDNAPAGVYYHYTNSGYNDYNQIVNISAPVLSLKKISERTIYQEENPTTSTITIGNVAGINMTLSFVKEGEAVMRETIPGATVETVTENSEFTVTTTSTTEKGNWDVYAKFETEKGGNCHTLNTKANDYAYVIVGTLKVAQKKNDESASMTVSATEVQDGYVFEILVAGPKNTTGTLTDTGVVTVKYYKDGETSSDAVDMTTTSENLNFLEGQAQMISGSDRAFAIPDSGQCTIGIQANTGTIWDTTYHFEVYVTGCGADKAGGVNNPLKGEIRVVSDPEPGCTEYLKLRAGWNFISVPMNLDSSMKEVSDYFEGVDMDERGVFGYDSSTKTWKQLSASTVLEPLEGYWVYSKTDFVGTKRILYDTNSMSIGATKNIYKGWNAVGLNIDVTQGKNTLSAKSTFAGLDWNRYFEKYTTGAWTVIVNGGSTSESEENYIYAGAGGWLYANEDGVLVGNSA